MAAPEERPGYIPTINMRQGQIVTVGSERYLKVRTLSQSEKYRFVTMLGRVKETTTGLRRLHAKLHETYDEVMQDPLFSFALTGDLKYLLTMNGNAGSSSTCPCPVCVRKRVNLVMTAPSLTCKRTLTEQLICRANAAG